MEKEAEKQLLRLDYRAIGEKRPARIVSHEQWVVREGKSRSRTLTLRLLCAISSISDRAGFAAWVGRVSKVKLQLPT